MTSGNRKSKKSVRAIQSELGVPYMQARILHGVTSDAGAEMTLKNWFGSITADRGSSIYIEMPSDSARREIGEGNEVQEFVVRVMRRRPAEFVDVFWQPLSPETLTRACRAGTDGEAFPYPVMVLIDLGSHRAPGWNHPYTVANTLEAIHENTLPASQLNVVLVGNGPLSDQLVGNGPVRDQYERIQNHIDAVIPDITNDPDWSRVLSDEYRSATRKLR